LILRERNLFPRNFPERTEKKMNAKRKKKAFVTWSKCEFGSEKSFFIPGDWRKNDVG